jgi:hypothetical protein
VKDRAGGAGFENAAGVSGIERAEDLALADQRMADRTGDAEDGCCGGKGDGHWSATSISPIFRWTRFTAFKGRIMTLRWVMRPVSSKLIMSIPFIAIPSISHLNSRMSDLSLDYSPTYSTAMSIAGKMAREASDDPRSSIGTAEAARRRLRDTSLERGRDRSGARPHQARRLPARRHRRRHAARDTGARLSR